MSLANVSVSVLNSCLVLQSAVEMNVKRMNSGRVVGPSKCVIDNPRSRISEAINLPSFSFLLCFFHGTLYFHPLPSPPS
ncbi:hypothetical protein RJT34_31750 [Clitoria ternatea]|uniref:Uncharacterized protein n=1 Tax=Clitoria ternatea TaxID=43366 RepID=A0AAN9I8Q1_CLITE